MTATSYRPSPSPGIDRNTTLCLTCASSLPPLRSPQFSDKNREDAGADIFITPCCRRPICQTCISGNPRLKRYNPCLACLGGVGVISSQQEVGTSKQNVDGGLKDEDTYIIGDEDEDEMDGTTDNPPPSYSNDEMATDTESSAEPKQEDNSGPSKYYIKKGDTLQGIAFRFGVNGRELCLLNSLPLSTLTTTPHLLHTRFTLDLPLSAELKSSSTSEPSTEDKTAETNRVRERAQKRLQMLTKETDWHVAKVYVDLAEELSSKDAYHLGKKEMAKENGKRSVSASGEPSLEASAIDSYLDDEAWEAQELKDGRKASIPTFPYAATNGAKVESGQSSWWHWK